MVLASFRRYAWGGIVALTVLCGTLAGCGVSAGGSSASQGVISGVVMAGPTCGAEPAGSPGACAPRPVAGKTVNIIAIGSTATVTSAQLPTGPIVASATTNAQGRFRVSVPPGRYLAVVAPTSGFGMRQISFPQVTVAGGQTATVTVELDTGVR
ncbi:MAG TPA: carboxypeptidase-like regulatory domain-containing protein [Ktedonobacterales bacterium]|nr:carboxypeptidase-like regulatory domain-containing protein [Ktedonobacterales bacterium]